MRNLLLFACVALTVIGCSSSDGSDGNSADNFNRTALLTAWADDIIAPSYADYKNKVEVLYAKGAAFSETGTPTQEKLDALRAAWLDAYKAYQYVGMFEIGPAETMNLKGKANTFPANAEGIEANIASANYNLAQFSQFDKQGFPALDYLINGAAQDDAGILAYYGGAAGGNRKNYLMACITELQTIAVNVDLEWHTPGGFRDAFVASNGTAVSSSVNKMTNLFVKYLEKDIRTGKIGIPAGLFSNGMTFPDKVEGYYKGDISRMLYAESINAAYRFFNSVTPSNETSTQSLAGYLNYVEATRDGQALSGIINNQFATVNESINTLDANLSQQVFTDNSKMVAAYNVLQQQVVYVKLDMLQALNITIDYVDGDGD